MTITITSPTDYQIFQRNGSDLANIVIAGTYTGSPVSIEASWNGGAYSTIVASPSGGTFSGTLTNQPAGQGTLTVRFTDIPATLDTAAYVGVGDVFLVTGQSNAAGYGTNSQAYSHATLKAAVWRVGASAWANLTDPASTGADGSSWPLLATLHMASQGVPVAFITTGVTSTGLNSTGEWLRGGAQYNDCLETLENSGATGIKAILWYQGETECNQAEINPSGKKEAYRNALSQMLDDMQADSAILAGVKMVSAQIGYKTSSGSTRTGIDPIRTAQSEIWDIDPDILEGPLLYDIDLSDGDGVHIGQGVDGDAELLTAARRWWRVLNYHFYDGTQGRAAQFSHSIREGRKITVVFDGNIPLTGVSTSGWRFTDNGSPIAIQSATITAHNRVVLTLASEPTGVEKLSYGSGNDAAGVAFRDAGKYPLPPTPFVDQEVAQSVEDSTFEFYVDIEDSSGNKLGSGPLTSVEQWKYTARFDRAGSISFSYAATDPQAHIVTNRVIARAWARLDGIWTEVGAGVVDNIQTQPNGNGRVSLVASGLDLTRELNYRGVGTLEIGAGGGATHVEAVEAIEALAPSGWTFLPASAPDNDYIYARYGGESVLGACVYLADRTQTHFYRASNRTLVFTSDFEDSGVRAIQAYGDLEPETCAIVSLKRTVDTHDLLTRIPPFGSGQGEARLTIAATTRTAPVGYTLNKTLNYIENDSATAAYGLIDYPEVSFKEITPISGTDADLEAAADMLFDAALEELRRRSTLASQETYTLTVAGCKQLLRPLQTIEMIYRDDDQGIDVDRDLYILETTWLLTPAGIQTTQLVVSTDDLWPKSDTTSVADAAVEGKVFQAHPQLNANSYVIAYNKNVDPDEMATFRFRFGSEIVNLQQVLFEFQLLPFESTVKTIAGATSGSGTITTTVPSTNTSGTPSNNTSGTPSNNTSDVPSNNTSGAPSVTDSGTPSTNTSGSPSVTDTGNNTSITVGTPTGGDVISAGQHQHTVHITNSAASVAYPIGYGAAGKAGGLVSMLPDTDHDYVTNQKGDHTHALTTHTHTLSSHTHTLNNHTHSLNSHTHSLNSHTHSLNSHTHGLNSHTHDLNNHLHDLSESLTAVYGIFREVAAKTYDIVQLEYQVNSGSWISLDTADDVSDGWYALDITSQVQNTTTFRPLQANNSINIRPKSALLSISQWLETGAGDIDVTVSSAHNLSVGAVVVIADAISGVLGSDINGSWTVTSNTSTVQFVATGTVLTNGDFNPFPSGTATPQHTATIDAQLSVRNTIQAVAYT
jgi:hypothetical protein